MLRLILALALLPVLLPAQTLERSFGLELTPHYGDRRVSGVNNFPVSRLKFIDSLETGQFGYGLGVTYESRVDRIGYTTGIRYTRVGYETIQQSDFAGGTFSDRVAGHYLALPFELNFYQDVSERDRALFLLGVAGQCHLGTTTRRTSFVNGNETGTETVEGDVDYRPLVLAFTTGIGYDRKLSDYWAIRFQPTFQFFLKGNLRPGADAAVNRNYYQLGFRIVVRRLFI